MVRERDHLPSSGSKHAVLIALFDARKAGEIITNDGLKRAVAEEYGDNHAVISDKNLYDIVGRLRQALQDSDSGYQIINRRGFGYEINSTEEIEKKQLRK
ncbi:helix-turn-helix domain-containing protein [Patescibacteria group bacterium]|nr:helix-turn-helix domain-containing protein [Patescibacteria group bacterium]